MAMLEVRDLEVYYGVIQALKGISFDVNQGEIVALIGANGAERQPHFRHLPEFFLRSPEALCLREKTSQEHRRIRL